MALTRAVLRPSQARNCRSLLFLQKVLEVLSIESLNDDLAVRGGKKRAETLKDIKTLYLDWLRNLAVFRISKL